MGRISQETIDRINDSADIVEVVSKSVELKKRGRNYFGLCPFHDEKTPSFSVAPDKGIYHCFGCGKGGNAINFIIENEKLSFVEAVQQLGQQLGIPVELSGSNESSGFFDNMYKVHDAAANLYHKTLFSERGQRALKYLMDRGLSRESIEFFKVGFAPESSKYLLNSIRSDSYEKQVLEKCGLFGSSKNKFFDRFRSRIMFPIWNASGKIVGFGGRVFASDDPAKYMNSPETPIYKKSDIFYGLHQARESIRKEGFAILVEGYTDVMQLFQNKIKNCVAVSGTAFSDRHVKQMKRFTTKVLLAYDGDFAGVSATLKTGYSLIKGDIDCEVIEIPNKFDPDEWVSKRGPEAFINEGVQKSTSLVDYHLKSSNFSELSPSEKSTVVNQILTEVRGISNPIISNDIIKKLAEKSNAEEHEIKNMIPKMRNFRSNDQPVEEKENETFNTINDKSVFGVIRVLLHGETETKEWISNNLEVDKITNTRLKKLIERMLPIMNSSSSEIISVYDDEMDRRIISQIMIEEDSSIDFMQMSIDCLSSIKKDYTRQKINQFRQKIRQLEADGKDTTDLMSEVLQMQKDMNA
jgi:DNA primase